jgi:RNA polymerase-binding transcription factor DksA
MTLKQEFLPAEPIVEEKKEESMSKHEDMRQRLLDRLKELNARLHHIEDELDEPRAEDFSDHATESESDEVLEHLGLAGLDEIEAIRKAFERIEAGTFGICVKCEEEISKERLELVPHTPLCRNCAR